MKIKYRNLMIVIIIFSFLMIETSKITLLKILNFEFWLNFVHKKKVDAYTKKKPMKSLPYSKYD
jgi:hypothetical protein